MLSESSDDAEWWLASCETVKSMNEAAAFSSVLTGHGQTPVTASALEIA